VKQMNHSAYNLINNMNLNHIPNNADAVLTGLNPPPLAHLEGALYNHDRSLWNILEKAGFISGTGPIPASDMYYLLIRGKLNTSLKIGIADLLPHIDAPRGGCVRIEPQFVQAFVEEIASKKVKKIGLMGEKVIKAFVKEFPHLRFNSIRSIDNFMGEIEFSGHRIEVFALPFPNNNNIADKFLYYKNMNK
jgi:hypothetical protein